MRPLCRWRSRCSQHCARDLARGYGTWDLAANGAGTLLKFNESALGRISEEGMVEKDKGWQFLWQTLKAHVEGSPVPQWVD